MEKEHTQHSNRRMDISIISARSVSDEASSRHENRNRRVRLRDVGGGVRMECVDCEEKMVEIVWAYSDAILYHCSCGYSSLEV